MYTIVSFLCHVFISLLLQIVSYERLASVEMRQKKAKEIYDRYIYVELLVMNTKVRPCYTREATYISVSSPGFRETRVCHPPPKRHVSSPKEVAIIIIML